MSKYLAHRASEKSLTVFFYDKDPVTISSDNEMYAQVRERLARGQHQGIDALLDKATMIKTVTKGKFSVALDDGEERILLHGSMLPASMTKHVLSFVEAKINTDYIELFWKRCCENPSESARESLWDWIQANNLTLTDDGCFIGYRAVQKDFKDMRTKKMDNGIGKVVAMPRDEVDANRNNTCSTGLHIAAWDYAFNTYGGGESSGNIVIACKVNPKDVVAVPNDYNNQKMRVCEFTVLSVVTNKFDDKVVSSVNAEPINAQVSDDDYEQDGDVVLDTIELTVKTGRLNIPKKFASYLDGQGTSEYRLFNGFISPQANAATNAKTTPDKDGMIRLGKAAIEALIGRELADGDSVLVTAIDDGTNVVLSVTE